MLHSTILQVVGFELCSKRIYYVCMCVCIRCYILVRLSVCMCRYSKIVCSNQIFLLLDIVNMVGGEFRWWNSRNKKFLYIFFLFYFSLCMFSRPLSIYCAHHVPNVFTYIGFPKFEAIFQSSNSNKEKKYSKIKRQKHIRHIRHILTYHIHVYVL